MVYNAVDGCAKLGTDFDGLNQKWSTLKKDVNMIKFGGGFYCGKVGDIFVINGFYMDMRKAFARPGTCIYYFETQWASKDLAWDDFRGKVLGGTDPKTADPASLRNIIFKKLAGAEVKVCAQHWRQWRARICEPFRGPCGARKLVGRRLVEGPVRQGLVG